ncbi:MAG: ABC transporter ATP-binding protein [Candidatus Hodarchaeales archaeon]
MAVIIETNDLTKIFPPNIVAVDQLSLTVKEGEIFSFLGPNGAGKTTTVRLLTTLLTPTSGNATVYGFDVVNDSLNLRKNIGILTDRPNLYLRLTARRNLLFFAKMYGLAHETAKKRINEFAVQFDLADRLDSPVGSYSKGMKQKLGILRAMIHSPPLMFLDEPTAGLDPLAQSSVRETIAQAATELDTTIFMTTHNLPEAEKLADRIAIINNGRLLTLGSTADLRSQVSKANKLFIKFSKTVSTHLSLIQDIEGVISARVLDNEDSVELEVENITSITPIVINTLIKSGASILEVRPTKKSLEDIYKQIMEYSEGGLNHDAA